MQYEVVINYKHIESIYLVRIIAIYTINGSKRSKIRQVISGVENMRVGVGWVGGGGRSNDMKGHYITKLVTTQRRFGRHIVAE